MLSKKNQKILEFIALRLTKKVRWFLIGSANLALQGMNFQPSDIDILIRQKNKNEILDIFSDFEVLKSENLPSSEGEEVMIEIKGMAVEFCFENPSGFYSKFFKKRELEEIIVSNYVAIPCLKLENEVLAYERLDRKLKARMIKDFLKNKKGTERE